MLNRLFITLLITITIGLLNCSYIKAEEIKVATIKDLVPVTQEIKVAFEKEVPNSFVNIIPLKKDEIGKILKNNPNSIDIVIIDNLKFIQKLKKEALIAPKSFNTLGKDNLCIIVDRGSSLRAYMLYPGTVIMKGVIVSNPNFTSMGEYTKQYLKNLNLWDKMTKKLVFFENNASIIDTISRGHYDGGIVYCSFAKKSSALISDFLNPKYYSPIVYASGVNINIKPESSSYRFNNFLKTKIVKNILKKHYFSF